MAVERCRQVLEGAGVDVRDEDVLPLTEVDRIWPAYIDELRARAGTAERFTAHDNDALQHRLSQIAERVGNGSAVWLALSDSEPVGIEAPAAPLLRAGATYFVSSAADLMLASRSLADGLAVELNHLAAGDEFEIVAWGRFSTSGRP